MWDDQIPMDSGKRHAALREGFAVCAGFGAKTFTTFFRVSLFIRNFVSHLSQISR